MSKDKDKGEPTGAESMVPAERDPALARPTTVSRLSPHGFPAGEMDTTPTDLADYEGEFLHPSHKEPFGLKIVDDDPYGRTHHAKNRDYFWMGTKDEFKAQFEKA